MTGATNADELRINYHRKLLHFGSSNAHLLIGRGDGTFNNPVALPAGAQPNGVAIGDYNNDGRPDIAMSVFNGGNVQIHRNTGTN